MYPQLENGMHIKLDELVKRKTTSLLKLVKGK